MSTIRVNRFENTSGVGFGSCVQTANFQTTAVQTGTTSIPTDDTVPTSTEGFEIFTLAFTPKSATNKLKITVNATASSNIAGSYNIVVTLFQDSGTSAIATAIAVGAGSTYMTPVNLIHYMNAGTTSSTTFKVRIGATGAGTTTVNGQSSARLFGGTLNSSITIEEYQV
jgi:hypothetical protein